MLVGGPELVLDDSQLNRMLDTPRLARVRRPYLRAIQYLDKSIGELVDTLKNHGLKNSMTIALIADHGEELMEHGSIGHRRGHLFDEVIHVPLIISAPGSPKEWCSMHSLRSLTSRQPR